MKSVLLLRGLRVEQANAIAGHTYGFPAVSHFLGFCHALSRALQSTQGLTLGGCAIVCHDHQVHCHQPGGYGDHVFALTRNPLTREGKTAPFVEEGRMSMTVSLVIECAFTEYDLDFEADDKAELIRQFQASVATLVGKRKLAGGAIVGLETVEFMPLPETRDDYTRWTKRLLFSLLPGFILRDQSALLLAHWHALRETDSTITLLAAWLDFFSLKRSASVDHSIEAPDETTPAEWLQQASPASGWCVPLALGYRAVSPLYAPGEVARTRDPSTPFRFVELAYGVGQWLSPHRCDDIAPFIWRYHHQQDGYLCQQSPSHNPTTHSIQGE